MARTSHDHGILEAALIGYQFERTKLDEKIREIQTQLRGKPAPATIKRAGKVGGKREMSASARARIAAAQKKRWAEFHKQKALAEKAS